MTHLTEADLQELPGAYDSPRSVGEVLIGDDAAAPLLKASSSGDDTTLRDLLQSPQWTKVMLEEPHTIYGEHHPPEGPNDIRQVMAKKTPNLERALTAAAGNNQAATVTILVDFAKKQGKDTSDLVSRSLLNTVIQNGSAAVLKALSAADPDVVNFPIGHGVLPLYEAARWRQADVVATLLELGADPLHPVDGKKLGSYNSSLLSLAATADGPRMVELLLERKVPIPGSGALHTAAHRGQLDTMRVLIRHGADVNEALGNWKGRTPLHFAASQGQRAAMELLRENGAREDVKDDDGKTAQQLLG